MYALRIVIIFRKKMLLNTSAVSSINLESIFIFASCAIHIILRMQWRTSIFVRLVSSHDGGAINAAYSG